MSDTFLLPEPGAKVGPATSFWPRPYSDKSCVLEKAATEGIENRPQFSFLPPSSDRGAIKAMPQCSLCKTKQIL
ncbi:hypothetical protein BGZ81_007875 [Podila clonocystis]|nr:hypothetical protein BGZ81_007875 [Podila clonocystis]